MLESIRRVVQIPRISSTQVFSVSVVLAFFWLLAHDFVHPFAIYLAQIFLIF
jgi:hypothetical protein